MSDFIERRIAIGTIVSTEYLRRFLPLYRSEYIEADSVRIIIGWCQEHFESYQQAPGKDIESIFRRHIKSLPEDKMERIERILQSLSDEFSRDKFNAQYLLDETEKYFRSQYLEDYIESIQQALSDGDISEADNLANSYQFAGVPDSQTVDPLVEDGGELVERVFAESAESLVKFPGALGQFWNAEMTRDAFVGIMAPEKRGKSWMLMEFVFRAARSGNNVALFQAGDMSEIQQLRRMYVYLARKSYRKKYCGSILIPVLDCEKNQKDSCMREERECDFGLPFQGDQDIFSTPFDKIIEWSKELDDYRPCRNCKGEFEGSFWFTERPPCRPLSARQAYRKSQKMLRTYGHRIRISTWSNRTLSVQGIEQQLDSWENQEEFVPDVIVIDYADLLVPSTRIDFRHQQNFIWMDLRGLSQKRHCLVVTATQADAQSYDQNRLKLSNFSEDKRKYSHVTAMYGLNQTWEEKRKGIMRINQLVVREDDFDISNEVHVLQRLQIGRPVIGCFDGYSHA